MLSPVSLALSPRGGSLLLFLAINIITISSTSADASTGTLTWGQACSPSASLYDDPSARCDTSKRLSCDMRTSQCKCHHGDRDFYNGAEDRCETKVGKFCSHSETFPTICVKNAECDPASNFCKCSHGAESNDDGTACLKENDDDDANSATSLKDIRVHFTIALMLLGGLWL